MERILSRIGTIERHLEVVPQDERSYLLGVINLAYIWGEIDYISGVISRDLAARAARLTRTT